MMRTVLFLALALPAAAADAVVTLQYQNPHAAFAAGTSRLKIETLDAIVEAFPTARDHVVNNFEGQIDKLSADELKKNFREAKAAIAALGTGALLVINCHSSVLVVGVPNEKGETELIPWADFWKHFGIDRPPRLALAVVNGCVGKADDSGVKGEAGEADLERVRRWLSAQALVSGTRSIATEETQQDLTTVMKRLKSDEGRLQGWDVELAGDKGAFHDAKVLRLRKGPLFADKSVTVNGLKHRAVEFSRPGTVTADGPRDAIQACEDDVDGTLDPDAAVRGYGSTEGAGWTPFRFEFRPRGKITGLELELTATPAADASADRAVWIVAGKEREMAKLLPGKDGKIRKVVELDEALLAQAATGRLRCRIGPNTGLTSAFLTVTYAAK